MSWRVHSAATVAVLVLAFCGTAALVEAAEAQSGDTRQAYRMTLQILGGVSSCGDDWSGPEYYAAATRRDAVVEKELEAVEKELVRLVPRVEAFNERIEPLLPREHNTVPLTEDERRELEELRSREQEIQETLEKQGELPAEERYTLEQERVKINRSVEQLENSVPLTEEEVRFLEDQREQRSPLIARKNVLEKLEANLTSKISMKTPGWLRVYENDVLELKLMEDDAFADDTCVIWPLTLDRDLLSDGGTDLESGGRPLLRLWVQED